MSEQEQKNAAAGQRQRQHLKEDRQKTGMMFENAGLTRKNEDFMYQLNKQLDAQGATAEAKTALLEETMTALLEGQKTGQTAKGLFGTPTKYADELLHPKKTPAEQQQTSTVLMSVDNGLMFFAIFTFMFGLIGLMQPSTLKLAQHGSVGLVAIILVAVAGGAAFGFVNKILLPTVDENGKQHRRPLWLRIVLVLGALMAWILVYMLVAFLPNAINPVLNAWAYLILGVAAFFGDVYFRQRYHIVGGFWGSSANRRRR
ncbi:DUF1129 domain-containing protein [Limosilactobacillus fermentum]|uniref:DUF1129 domain-containing protein n=1 Tax=Limosilactobacillus fermentum TaxID=1613 RepID=UPI000FECB876|nr:DUF1129 domain-containing protein [Limosilactobacillus fermentum]QAR22862.1 DUF1129 domain-containing protein [Limosilactobacillus fermentum]